MPVQIRSSTQNSIASPTPPTTPWAYPSAHPRPSSGSTLGLTLGRPKGSTHRPAPRPHLDLPLGLTLGPTLGRPQAYTLVVLPRLPLDLPSGQNQGQVTYLNSITLRLPKFHCLSCPKFDILSYPPPVARRNSILQTFSLRPPTEVVLNEECKGAVQFFDLLRLAMLAMRFMLDLASWSRLGPPFRTSNGLFFTPPTPNRSYLGQPQRLTPWLTLALPQGPP